MSHFCGLGIIRVIGTLYVDINVNINCDNWINDEIKNIDLHFYFVSYLKHE